MNGTFSRKHQVTPPPQKKTHTEKHTLQFLLYSSFIQAYIGLLRYVWLICRELLCLILSDEVDYLFSGGGTFGQNPQAWEKYKEYIQDTSIDWEREQTNLLGAYWDRLTSADPSIRAAAASAFVGYELSISKAYIDPLVLDQVLGTPTMLIPFAVMEVHYMINGRFLKRGQLLDGAGVLAKHGIQVSIAHGRGDYVCQPQAAWRLAKALRQAGAEVRCVQLRNGGVVVDDDVYDDNGGDCRVLNQGCVIIFGGSPKHKVLLYFFFPFCSHNFT